MKVPNTLRVFPKEPTAAAVSLHGWIGGTFVAPSGAAATNRIPGPGGQTGPAKCMRLLSPDSTGLERALNKKEKNIRKGVPL